MQLIGLALVFIVIIGFKKNYKISESSFITIIMKTFYFK